MGLVILDIQHRGKPHAPSDRGAGFDLDGDGKVEPHEQEVHHIVGYVAVITQRLAEHGHHVALIATGEYGDRHDRAAGIYRSWAATAGQGPALYCACHVNSAGVGYGMVLHDRRSDRGEQAATWVASALAAAWRSAGRARDCKVIPTSTQSWARAHVTIDGIYSGPPQLAGLCLEPTAVDRAEDLSPEGLRRMGTALADGLHHALTATAGGPAPQI